MKLDGDFDYSIIRDLDTLVGIVRHDLDQDARFALSEKMYSAVIEMLEEGKPE